MKKQGFLSRIFSGGKKAAVRGQQPQDDGLSFDAPEKDEAGIRTESVRDAKTQLDSIRQMMAFGIAGIKEEEEAKTRASRRIEGRGYVETETAADQDESLRNYDLLFDDEHKVEARGSDQKKDRPLTQALEGGDFMSFDISKTLAKHYDVSGALE